MPESQPRPAPGILGRIVATKRAEVEAVRSRAAALERAASAAPPTRGFARALTRGSEVALVAECKRKSPGAGDIRPGLVPGSLAAGYERAGAAALSVLTDGPWFGGSLGDLAEARAATSIPLLRKDFTIDTSQVIEARAAGADAVLLIVRILDDDRLAALLALAEELGMDALVETHDAGEVRRALGAGATLLGVNNRDLDTFTTDLETTVALLDAVPGGVAVVSESGIRSPGDVRRLGAAGVDAVLVGETLLRAQDPAAAAGDLSGILRAERRHA